MIELPASSIAPARISSTSPNGLFFPFRPDGGIMLAIVIEGQPMLVELSGEKRFSCYRVRPGYRADGALITDVEFRVDLSSMYNSERETDPLGAVVLREGGLSLIAYKTDDVFGEPFDLPLWGKFHSYSEDGKIGFKMWSIVVHDGDEHVTLWSSEQA